MAAKRGICFTHPDFPPLSVTVSGMVSALLKCCNAGIIQTLSSHKEKRSVSLSSVSWEQIDEVVLGTGRDLVLIANESESETELQ